MATTFQINGVDAVLDRATRYVASITGSAPRALRSVGELWMTASKERTPVDTGALKGSGHVQGPFTDGNDTIVKLVYGGPAAGYAIVVHEDLTARHDNGQSKFLESVVAERGQHLAKEMAPFLTPGVAA